MSLYFCHQISKQLVTETSTEPYITLPQGHPITTLWYLNYEYFRPLSPWKGQQFILPRTWKYHACGLPSLTTVTLIAPLSKALQDLAH